MNAFSRALRLSRFDFIAVLTLAVGIFVNVAAFAICDTLLFRPLPFRDADRLAQIHLLTLSGDDAPHWAVLPQEIAVSMQDELGVFSGLAWTDGWLKATVPAAGDNPLALTPVTANLLSVLGVQVAGGRDFVSADADSPTDLAVLLKFDAWLARFGGTTDFASLRWHDGPLSFRVVGVLPKTFLLPSSALLADFDGLFAVRDRPQIRPGQFIVAPVVRLRADVPIADAQRAVDQFMSRHRWVYAGGEQAFRDRRQRITVQPLRNGMTSLIRSHLMLVSIGSWAVLLLSCTNATLLLAVRAANRRRDTAIRMAVGASGPRLIKDIVVEATAITMYGAVIAWLTWAVARSVLVASVPASIRGFTVDATDGRVMALSLILPAICSIVASVIPVMLALKADPLMLLRIDDADQSMTAIPGTKVLLCIEAALCCGALIIAQATVPPFIKLMIAGPGFNAQDLFVADVSHGTTEDDPYGNGHRFERVSAIGDVVSHQPNIQQMAMALRAPFDSTSLDSPFWKAVGREGAEYGISSGLFATLGVPVTAGRDISDSDVREAREVALVNETGASALTPNEDTRQLVGRVLDVGDGSSVTIVGIIKDFRSRPGAPVIPQLFRPITSTRIQANQTSIAVLCRTTPGHIIDDRLMATALNDRFGRETMRVRSVERMLSPTLEQPRFLATLFGCVGLVSLVQCLTGMIAVSGFEILRHKRRAAICIALGAPKRKALAPILFRLIWPVGIGACLGAVAAMSYARLAGRNLVAAPSSLVALAAVLCVCVLAVVTVLGHLRHAGNWGLRS